jgi:hypothetical protein
MSESEVQAYATARHFGPATLTRWLAEAPADRDALLALAQRLRVGENQFRDLYDAVADLAARDGTGLASVIEGTALRAVLARPLGRNEALRALRQALRRLRYPQLTRVEDRLAGLVRGLRLPAGVRVEFPADLEGEDVAVTLRARSGKELRAQALALAAAAQDAAVDEMFALLAGEW